jgi:hypothetical protein
MEATFSSEPSVLTSTWPHIPEDDNLPSLNMSVTVCLDVVLAARQTDTLATEELDRFIKGRV